MQLQDGLDNACGPALYTFEDPDNLDSAVPCWPSESEETWMELSLAVMDQETQMLSIWRFKKMFNPEKELTPPTCNTSKITRGLSCLTKLAMPQKIQTGSPSPSNHSHQDCYIHGIWDQVMQSNLFADSFLVVHCWSLFIFGSAHLMVRTFLVLSFVSKQSSSELVHLNIGTTTINTGKTISSAPLLELQRLKHWKQWGHCQVSGTYA